MKLLGHGVIKFFVTNFMVLVVFMLLPVFLITNQVPFFDSTLDYLFNNEAVV